MVEVGPDPDLHFLSLADTCPSPCARPGSLFPPYAQSDYTSSAVSWPGKGVAAVTLWWIGNAVLLVVTLVLFALLNRFMKPVRELRKRAKDIIEHATTLSGNLNAVPKLVQTQQLVATAREGVEAYGTAITNLL